MGRARYAWVTLAPMLFMTATTATAGIWNIVNFAGPKFVGKYGATFSVVNIALSVVLLACVAVILGASVKRWRELWATPDEDAPAVSAEEPAATPVVVPALAPSPPLA
jgi:carbon starvation protein